MGRDCTGYDHFFPAGECSSHEVGEIGMREIGWPLHFDPSAGMPEV